MSEIIRILSVPTEGLDTDLLADVFSVRNLEDPPSPPKKSKRTRKKRGKGSTRGVSEIPPGNRKMIEITKVKNGFIIQKHPNAEKGPISVDVKVAYDVLKGKPFNKYRDADFDFSKLNKSGIKLDARSAIITEQDKNHFSFTVLNSDFKVSLTGFDEYRDLIIDAKPHRRKT